MVSVIIPTYNREKTILRSIESVLKQTYSDFEIIIVDDGSSDNTKKVVSEIQDDRITYFKQKNAGAAAARNTGIKLAKGEFIAFQDSDDVWHSDKLEIQMDVMNKTGADMVFCSLYRANYSDKIWPNLEEGFVDYKDILDTPSISTQTILAKREVFKNDTFNEKLPALEDYAFSFVIASKFKVYHVKKVLVDLYLQEDSLTASLERYVDGYKKLIEIYDEYYSRYPKIKAKRLYIIGCMESEIGNYDIDIFKKSFSIYPNLKCLIKMMMLKIKLLKG